MRKAFGMRALVPPSQCLEREQRHGSGWVLGSRIVAVEEGPALLRVQRGRVVASGDAEPEVDADPAELERDAGREQEGQAQAASEQKRDDGAPGGGKCLRDRPDRVALQRLRSSQRFQREDGGSGRHEGDMRVGGDEGEAARAVRGCPAGRGQRIRIRHADGLSVYICCCESGAFFEWLFCPALWTCS